MLKKLNATLFTLLLASPLFLSFYQAGNRFEIIREVAPLLALGVGILTWLFVRGFKKSTQPTSLPLLLLFLGFLLTTTLSWMSSDITSFGFAEVFVLWMCFLVYLPFSQEETWGPKVTRALALTLVAASVIGVYGYLTTDHTRFFGFFYNPELKPDAWPNAYADFFLMTFPFLTLLLFDTNRKGRVLSLATLLLLAFVLAGFVLTASRGAFLALIPALGFFALVQLHRHRFASVMKLFKLKTLLSGLVILICTVAFTTGITNLKNQSSEAVDLGARLNFAEAEGGNSFSERLQFFEGALTMIREKPLLGYGPSSFKFAYQAYQQGFLAISDHPHNLWLKLAVERGIPSALFLLAFLGFLFVKTNPFRKDSRDTFTLAAWTGLLALLAHSMIDYNLNFVTNALIFWFILGVLASQTSKKKTHLAPAALLLVSVLVAAAGLKLAIDELTFNRLQTVAQVEAFHPLLPSYEWYEKIGSTQDPLFITATIQKQIDSNPMDSNGWSLLGQEKEREGDLEAAREAYEKSIEVSPKNTFSHYLALAKILTLQNDAAALQTLSDQLAPLFEEYQKLYDANLHFTRGTKEMEYVEELKAILPSQL